MPAAPDVFDRIRDACAQVARGATWVRIDEDRLASYAHELAPLLHDVADDDPGRARFDDVETTVAFVLALDAINFGSGWFPVLRKRPGMSGYHTVATTLREHVAQQGALPAEELAAMTPARVAALFGQRLDEPAGELMTHFAAALGDLGRLVRDEHDGSFAGFVATVDHSAAALVEALDRLPHFRDVFTWRGLEVPLYKRAQISANDLSLALGGEGLGRFDDIDRLTMFADNLVPHVLRVDGVLVFDPALVARIDAVEDITSGSAPEVEIRAVGLHAVEQLGAAIGALGVAARPRDLDTFLWNRGGGARYKAVPRHRTRCVYY